MNGEREREYGVPEYSFATIGRMWEVYLTRTHIDLDITITPKDAAAMMALLKIARIAAGSKLDNWMDLAGYAAC